MATEITDYVSVHQRAANLGCTIPLGLALLPTNFDSATAVADFLQRSEAATVRSLFRSNNIALDELLPASERAPYVQNNSFEWLAPILFISSALISDNPVAVELALHVLATYIADFFKGMPGDKTVKLAIVVEKRGDRSCKILSYKGDSRGLSALPDIIKQISND